jgi:hypothetical protein
MSCGQRISDGRTIDGPCKIRKDYRAYENRLTVVIYIYSSSPHSHGQLVRLVPGFGLYLRLGLPQAVDTIFRTAGPVTSPYKHKERLTE